MKIPLSRPMAAALKVVGVLALAYVVYQEGPPMYRYIFKFEAM